MIDLKNKCAFIRTQEEYEKILEEAEKQGFKWYGRENTKPMSNQKFPCVLKFDSSYKIFWQLGEFLDVSKLFGKKELTASELIDFIVNINRDCNPFKCEKCVLSSNNTKCKWDLCTPGNWGKDNKEELISLARSGRTTIKSQNEMILESFQDFLDSPTITNDFIESLQIVVDKLKEQVN